MLIKLRQLEKLNISHNNLSIIHPQLLNIRDFNMSNNPLPTVFPIYKNDSVKVQFNTHMLQTINRYLAAATYAIASNPTNTTLESSQNNDSRARGMIEKESNKGY